MRLIKRLIQKREFGTLKTDKHETGVLKTVKHESEVAKTTQFDNSLFYPPAYPERWLSKHLKPLIIDSKKTHRHINALDLACGTGQFSLQLTPLFEKVLGVDSNENQLKYAEKIGEAEIKKGKLEFKKVEYSKIEELFTSLSFKFRDYKFIFLAQGFERYDYEKFISSFRTAVPEKDSYLVLLGFPVFTILPESEKLKKGFFDFSQEILSFYQFNPFSIAKEYKDVKFSNVFEFVEFSNYMDQIKGEPLLDFLKYLSSWGAYRNYLEANKGQDPFLDLMESLDLKNFKEKDFDKIEFGGKSPRTISYKTEYFMYILK